MKNERRIAVGVWPLVGAARISLRAHPGNTTPRREPWKVRNLTHLNRLRWGLRSVPGEQSLPPMTTFQVLHQDRMEENSKDTPRHTHTLTRCWVSFELCSPDWLVQTKGHHTRLRPLLNHCLLPLSSDSQAWGSLTLPTASSTSCGFIPFQILWRQQLL